MPPTALVLAESAAAVATEAMSTGKPPAPEVLAEARANLSKALEESPRDLGVLFLAFQFHFRLGELDVAERYVERRLELVAPESADAARALTNLGLIAQFRKDLDRAEELMGRAVEIDRWIGNLDGLARDLGNLALAPEARGDLDRAEALFKEAMEVARRVPGARGEELVAGNISNLGDIAKARGRMDEAREKWMQAQAVYERLGITKWKALFEKRFAELEGLGGEGKG